MQQPYTNLAPELAPLKVSELLDLSFAHLVKMAPRLALLLIVGVLMSEWEFSSPFTKMFAGIIGWGLTFYGCIASVYMCSEYRWGRNPNFLNLLRNLKVTQFIGAMFLSFWVGIATVFFCILLIVPGLIYFVNRILAVPIYLIEHGSMSQALWRSKFLMTRGKWYSLNSPMMRISIVMLVIPVLNASVAVGGSFQEYFGWDSNWSDAIKLSWTVTLRALQCLLAQFSYVAYTNFYYDMRARYEGLDLFVELETQKIEKI